MNGDFAIEEALAHRIGEFLYGQIHPTDSIALPVVHVGILGANAGIIDEFLQRMNNRQLIRLALAGGDVYLTTKGKEAHEFNCIPELVLGEQYIAHKYQRAVVHIIVRDGEGHEAGGTGFFVNHPVNRIVTAKHVLEDHALVRVEDQIGNQICDFAAAIHLGLGPLDLALIECEMPQGVYPFRVEWREDAVHELDRVLIFGYPPFAGHHVGLLQARGEINARVAQLSEERRYSLMISNVTAPGCSGGPVVSEAGTAIAVVSRENTFMREGNPLPIHFVSAVLACYLQDVNG
jgi:hypothetical protein